jgi:hypothetical protein
MISISPKNSRLYWSDRGDAVGRYSVPGETSFISRFTLKFVEIVAAGVATAVSGYIVAHLSGFFPATGPTAVQVPTLQAAPQAVTSVNAANNPNAQPDLKPETNLPTRATADVAPPARKSITAEKSISAEKSMPAEKAAETSAPETKPHDTAEARSHDTAETKPHSPDSFEAQVRAALAKGESAKPVPVAPSRQAVIPTNVYHVPPAPEAQPRQTDAATGAIPVPPRAADAAPPQAPVLAEPPATVEIKSLPVAGVDTSPAPPQQAQAEAPPASNDFFSALKHIPDLLSPDSHPQVPADRAPRPPMPVGQ